MFGPTPLPADQAMDIAPVRLFDADDWRAACTRMARLIRAQGLAHHGFALCYARCIDLALIRVVLIYRPLAIEIARPFGYLPPEERLVPVAALATPPFALTYCPAGCGSA